MNTSLPFPQDFMTTLIVDLNYNPMGEVLSEHMSRAGYDVESIGLDWIEAKSDEICKVSNITNLGHQERTIPFTVLQQDRHYGGPAEGGYYFKSWTRLECVPVPVSVVAEYGEEEWITLYAGHEFGVDRYGDGIVLQMGDIDDHSEPSHYE